VKAFRPLRYEVPAKLGLAPYFAQRPGVAVDRDHRAVIA
jgi:hypothetical protein